MYLIQVGGDPATLNLSEQQLVSCCNSNTGFPYTDGCRGGNIDDVRHGVLNDMQEFRSGEGW